VWRDFSFPGTPDTCVALAQRPQAYRCTIRGHGAPSGRPSPPGRGSRSTSNPPCRPISSGMKSPKKKPTAAKVRRWRVALMRSRAIPLGTIEAPDPDAAEAEAVKLFGLSEDQRKRLLVMWERE
jgi:hypothetical protein